MFEAMQRLVDLGGPVVAILLALSVMGFATVLYKLIQLRGFNRATFSAIESTISSGPSSTGATAGDPAPNLLSPNANPVAQLVAFAMADDHHLRADISLDAEISRRGNRIIRDCASYLRLVELIAYLCPLLGLLGTVLGMIDAFRGLETQVTHGNAAVLAGGIWEALLTTALGLGIAVPMTASHALLETRVQNISDQLQDVLEQALAV